MLVWMLPMRKGRGAAWGILEPLYGSLGQQDRNVSQGMKTAIPDGAALHAAAKAVQHETSPQSATSHLQHVIPI